MIGNITRGANFEGVGRYLYATGKHHERHVNPRVVASENVMRDDSRQWSPWVADMRWCAGQRPEIAKPVWHCSVRAAPQDRIMTDAEWGQIASEHAEKMGLREFPWVAVRHGDDHVHIVACRVNGDGRLWRDSHDKVRNKESMRDLEHRHGLIRLVDDRPTTRLAAVTKSERERGERLGRDPERARLRDAMYAARDEARGRGVEAFEVALEARGVQHRANTTKDELKVRGYSVSLPGWVDAAGEQIWVKASEVDRRLSWAKLRTELGSDDARYASAIRAMRVASAAFPTRAEVAAARARGYTAAPARGYTPTQAAPARPRSSERDGPSR